MAAISSSSQSDISHAYTGSAGPAGTGLFAARDFEAGELVLRLEREVVSVLDSGRFGVACERCFLTEEDGEEDDVEVKLKKCGGCGVVKFCGEVGCKIEEEAGIVKCQTTSWKHHHKYECKIFKRLYPNVLPNTARLLMRILLRRQNMVLPSTDWEAFMKLQHHLDYFKAQKNPQATNTWENIQLIARAAKEYSGSNEDLGRVEAMIGRILINSLTLVTPTYTSLGLSLAPTAALLNHSCNPNAVVSFSGPILYLRTLLPIPKANELLISYIDITNPLPLRQTDLQSRYFFTCKCPYCSASPPQTLGHADPPPSIAAALSAKKLDELESRAKVLMQESLAPELLSQGPEARLKPLKQAMALFAPLSAYPPYRQPYAALRAAMVLALLAAEQWIPALIHSLITYFHVDPFQLPQAMHPVRVVHKWVLLKLVLQIVAVGQEGDEAVKALEEKWGLDWAVVVWGLLREVEGSVGGSHGVESRFAGRVRKEGERFRVDTRARWEDRGPGMGEVESEWGRLRAVAADGVGLWEEREKDLPLVHR
ncbi:hypothetical protein MMC30_006438 [Trapelia coarctata]|nr:hypothetical protein [Trapelia coarctata]